MTDAERLEKWAEALRRISTKKEYPHGWKSWELKELLALMLPTIISPGSSESNSNVLKLYDLARQELESRANRWNTRINLTISIAAVALAVWFSLDSDIKDQGWKTEELRELQNIKNAVRDVTSLDVETRTEQTKLLEKIESNTRPNASSPK